MAHRGENPESRPSGLRPILDILGGVAGAWLGLNVLDQLNANLAGITNLADAAKYALGYVNMAFTTLGGIWLGEVVQDRIGSRPRDEK